MQDSYATLERELLGHLAAVVEGMPSAPPEDDFSPAAILDRAEIGLASYGPVAEILRAAGDALPLLFARMAGHRVSALAVITCPDYFRALVPLFARRFDRFAIADTHKAGESIEGTQIEAPDALAIDAFDALFLPTSEHRVVELFRRRYPGRRILTLHDLMRVHRGDGSLDRARRLAERIDAAPRPLVVLSAIFPMTLAPTFAALEAVGFTIFFLHRQSLQADAGYAVPSDQRIPIEEHHHIAFDEMIFLLKSIRRGSVLFLAETLFHPRWDMKDTIGCYAYPAALMRMTRAAAVLLQYDAAKPVERNYQYEPQSEHCYRAMLDAADRIVLNSNGPMMRDFLASTAARGKPVESFHRYSNAPRRRLPKHRVGIHLCAISVLLSEAGEATRTTIGPQVRAILRQGIHLHYYTGWTKAAEFRDSLPEAERACFHLHAAILDQADLVDEITQYHAALLIADTVPFARLVANLCGQFYRDLFALFVPSTVPTSVATCGCAGLPLISHRWYQSINDAYPPGTTISLEFSEIGSLGDRLRSFDWNTAWATLESHTDRFAAAAQVARLVPLLGPNPDSALSGDRDVA